MIGVGLALLLGAAAAAVVARWVRHNASSQPTKQMERVTRGLLLLGGPWLVACVAALAVLRGQGTGFGALLFLAMTTTVTLLSPLCSGLCGYGGLAGMVKAALRRVAVDPVARARTGSPADHKRAQYSPRLR